MLKLNRSVVFVVLLIVTACLGIAQAADQLPRYTLNVVTGVPISPTYAKAINNKGDVLIWATDVKTKMHHSYLWSAGKATDLGTLGGKHEPTPPQNGRWTIAGTIGYGLNDKGQAVGVSQALDGNNHAFLWEKGKMRDLGTLGGKTSEAHHINNLGQVVGYSDTTEGDRHAFIWDSKSGMRDLGIPGKSSAAYKINEKGQAIGLYSADRKTFVWDNGTISYPELRPLVGFGAFEGLDINDRGDIVGVVDRGGTCNTFESHVFLWSDSKMIPVETTAKKSANAFGLTFDRLVVGNAFDTPTGQHAFVWQDSKYSLLNDRLAKSGWNVYFTVAVNDKGQIAAAARRDGKDGPGETVVLTPVHGAGKK